MINLFQRSYRNKERKYALLILLGCFSLMVSGSLHVQIKENIDLENFSPAITQSTIRFTSEELFDDSLDQLQEPSGFPGEDEDSLTRTVSGSSRGGLGWGAVSEVLP